LRATASAEIMRGHSPPKMLMARLWPAAQGTKAKTKAYSSSLSCHACVCVCVCQRPLEVIVSQQQPGQAAWHGLDNAP
jgi:hypothetical protein